MRSHEETAINLVAKSRQTGDLYSRSPTTLIFKPKKHGKPNEPASALGATLEKRTQVRNRDVSEILDRCWTKCLRSGPSDPIARADAYFVGGGRKGTLNFSPASGLFLAASLRFCVTVSADAAVRRYLISALDGRFRAAHSLTACCLVKMPLLSADFGLRVRIKPLNDDGLN